MFCNQCGAALQPDYNLCPRCGRPVATAPAAPPTRLEGRLRTVGILWIVLGGLILIPAVILMALGSTARIVLPGALFLRSFGPLVMFLVGGSFAVVAAAGICVGWGLIEHRSWARTAAILLGVLALFHPPFATALGIYTLWVLLAEDAGAEYRRLSSVSG